MGSAALLRQPQHHPALRVLFFTLALIAVAASSGCGPDVCTAKSKCPNEEAKTQTQIDSCHNQTARNVRCSDEATAFDSCYIDHEVCAMDGTSDANATNALCTSESAAYLKCLTTF